MLPTNTTEDQLASCHIFISICKPLGSSTCPGYPNSTTCQEVRTTSGNLYYYDMGTYSSNSEFDLINGEPTKENYCTL